MIRRIMLTACMLLPVWSAADIEKSAVIVQNGTHLMWWPKVGAPEGWHIEKGASQANAINILAPDGANFSNATTVIYAKAIYKPRDPGVKTLQALIDRDQAEFKQHKSQPEIRESTAMTIADGTPLSTWTYFPNGKGAKGNWEAVAYGEDGDYFVVFVMSSRTEQDYAANLPAFEKVVASYTREPKAVGDAEAAAPTPGGALPAH
jgi:hypothetical protein